MQRMIEVKTAELDGVALDWAAGIAAGFSVGFFHGVVYRSDLPGDSYGPGPAWRPSADWAHGGPLIESLGIGVALEGHASWGAAYKDKSDNSAWVFRNASWQITDAPTALIAACRAIVAANLGDVVSVPAELMP